MKRSKFLALVMVAIAPALAFAQNPKYNNMFKIGFNAGIAVPAENASSHIGLDLGYQRLVHPGIGVGFVTGYNHFMGQSKNGINNNDFGVIPLAGMFRYYPEQTGFYVGTDLGYGFITGEGKVASNSNVDLPDGGFYFKPEIGYHNIHWNFALQYANVFTGNQGTIGDQKFNAGTLGFGVSCNLPLGKSVDGGR